MADKTKLMRWALNAAIATPIFLVTGLRFIKRWPEVELENRVAVVIILSVGLIGGHLYSRQFHQPPTNTRPQFSLRTLLVASTLIAVVLGLLFWPSR